MFLTPPLLLEDMKRFRLFYIVALLCVCVCAYAQKSKPLTERDWARFGRYEKQNAELLTSGVRPDAIFMGNSGGAFDNAKKYFFICKNCFQISDFYH